MQSESTSLEMNQSYDSLVTVVSRHFRLDSDPNTEFTQSHHGLNIIQFKLLWVILTNPIAIGYSVLFRVKINSWSTFFLTPRKTLIGYAGEVNKY